MHDVYLAKLEMYVCLKIKAKEEIGYKNICDRLDVSWWRKIEQTIRMFVLHEQEEERERNRIFEWEWDDDDDDDEGAL